MKRFFAGIALFLASILPVQSQILYGPNLVNSSQAGIVLGPTTFPAQADTLIMTATAVNNNGVPSNVYFQTAPTQSGPWTNCASATSLGATASTETVTLSCLPQGALYYRVYVQGGPPQILNTAPFTLSSPRGVVYAAGQFWISDSGNNRLLNYNPTTNVTTVVTTTGFTLSNPGQLGEYNGTEIIIADTGNSRILVYSISGGTTTALSLGTPGGITPSGLDGVCGDDTTGKIYISDTGNNRILTYNTGTTTVTAIGVTVSSPHGCQVDSNTGNLYFADTGHNLVYEWTGGTATALVTTPQQLLGPQGAGFFNNSGQPIGLISDTQHSRIIQSIASTGSLLPYFNAPGFPSLVNPDQIYVAPQSFAPMVIANTGANNIVTVTFPNNGGSLSIGIVGINSLVSTGNSGVISTWNASTYYSLNAVVAYSGTFYQSLIASNQGNVPSSSPSDWTTSISGGGSSLPTASAALQSPVSTGSGKTYVSAGNFPLLNTQIHVVGVGPDTTVQTALNNAGAYGRVYIPAGTYQTNGLSVKPGQHIECENGDLTGAGGTTLVVNGANYALFNPNADASGSPTTNQVQGIVLTNCTFDLHANATALGGIRLKGILWSQFYNDSVIINSAVNPINPNGIVTGGTYTSGITATGITGQTCNLTSFNNGSSATATVALTGSNTIASGTRLQMLTDGSGATAAPTSATAGNGTATCSGTVTIATQLGGIAAVIIDGGNVASNGGAYFNDFYSLNVNDEGRTNVIGIGIYLTGEANDNHFFGGSVNFTGTSVLEDFGNNDLIQGMSLEDWNVNCIHTTGNVSFNEFNRVRCETASTNVSVQVDSGFSNVYNVIQICTACTFGVDNTNGFNSWHTTYGTFAGRTNIDTFGTNDNVDFVGINKIPTGFPLDGTAVGGLDIHGDFAVDRNLFIGQFGGVGSGNGSAIRSLATSPSEVFTIPDAPGGGQFLLSGSPILVSPLGTANSGANFNSTNLIFEASYWNGSAAILDTFTCSNNIATGATPAATLVCLHNGAQTVASALFENIGIGWDSITAATSGTNVVAPPQFWLGNYWNGTASVQDVWRMTPTLATGSNPVSSLVYTHTGSSGLAYIQFPAIRVAPARKGTFVCTAGGTITISNANGLATSDVVISINTLGGTVSTPPAMSTITPGTGFTVLCGAADTSTYNYVILN